MKEVGWLMLILGLALLTYGFVMDTTAGGFLTEDRVHNLGLLSNRVYIGILGGFMLLAGMTALAASTIVESLEGISSVPAPSSAQVSAEPDEASSEDASSEDATGEFTRMCESCGEGLTESGANWYKARPYCDTCFSDDVH